MGIVILAILAGLVGAYIVRSSLIREPVAVVTPTTVTVPLASVDLPEGRTVALGDVALASMTEKEMQDRGLSAAMAMMDPDQIIGRTLKEPLRQGKPFNTTAFYLEGTRSDFTRQLLPGQRAISLSVPKNAGGSLPPGTLVDLIFRSTEKKGQQGSPVIPEVTVRLLEGVRIIDVYDPPAPRQTMNIGLDLRRGINRSPPPPTVTMAVTPEQGDVIQTALGRGEMTLVARPLDERLASGGKRKPLSLQDVLGIEPPPPQILFATEIFRRGRRDVNVFRDDKLVEQMRAAAQADQAAPLPAPPAPTAPRAPTAPAPPAPNSGAATLQPTIPLPVPVPVPVVPVVPVVPGQPIPVQP
jgi:Flp pilus assembly protein CpaB